MKKNNAKPILLAPKLKSVIREEFEVSKVAVDNALAGRTNSFLAKKIREKAKELLIEELNKISD